MPAPLKPLFSFLEKITEDGLGDMLIKLGLVYVAFKLLGGGFLLGLLQKTISKMRTISATLLTIRNRANKARTAMPTGAPVPTTGPFAPGGRGSPKPAPPPKVPVPEAKKGFRLAA